MSFVTTNPEALEYAAGKLEGIGASVAAQNASAAAATAQVQPAAADEVSALQATLFSAYGNLYQQVSAHANAINQAFVQMLGLGGDSYNTTEAGNSAATGTTGLGGFSVLGQLTEFGQFGILPGALSEGSMDGLYGGTPFLGSASTFMGLMPPASSAATSSSANATSGDYTGFSLVSATEQAAAGRAAETPILASASQASSVGHLSVPQSWAVADGASTTSPTVAGSWSPAHSQGGPVATTVPGGVPSVASASRSAGPGRPRNGIKPRFMPKTTVI